MKKVLVAILLVMSGTAGPPADAQRDPKAGATRPAAAVPVPTKTVFVPLGQEANAILVEPVTPTSKSRVVVLMTHPEHVNNFGYFIGQELPRYGYRTMMLNYYGREQTYYEFLKPLAAAIRALRAMPGVDKVVLLGHSSGGAEVSSYQDVAENGAAACRGAERLYKCAPADAVNLPKADGIMLVDANSGAPEKTMALNPAVNEFRPRTVDPALDPYARANGYDPATRAATYGAAFLDRFFAAQAAKANRVIAEARDRLARIEAGTGDYRDDEPFVVAGAGVNNAGARVDVMDLRLLAHTRAPHPLLMPDGTTTTRIIARTMPAQGQPYANLLAQTTQATTVRHYLSFQGLSVAPDYRMTVDDVTGINWRSTANSVQGNMEGIRVPTFVMAATCSFELVLLEIGYDHAAAPDREFVGVEGADHNLRPCGAQYGDTYRRAFDRMDAWLSRPGRF